MSIKRQLLGYRDFWPESRIRSLIAQSNSFDQNSESTEKAKSLLIFQTSKQQTWLVSTAKRLYFILDDARKPRPKVLRSDSKEALLAKGDFKSSIKTRSRSERTGIVDIGEGYRGWLYSKYLFTNEPIEKSISDVLETT